MSVVLERPLPQPAPPPAPARRLAPATGLRLIARGAVGRSYPRLIGANRDRSWLFFDLLLPLLGTMSFVFVYKTLGAPEQYVGYVIMGGATTAFWMNVMWAMAAQLYWDKRGGNMEIFMTAPCGLPAILFGMAMGGMVGTLVRSTFVVTIGSWLFGVTYDLSQIPLLLAVFAVAMVGLYALGVALASLFLLWGREAYHLANTMMEPVFLVAGFYFPVKALGTWAGLGASLVPLTLALDAMRQILFGPSHPALLPLGVEIAILAALSAALVVLARRMLVRMEMLARREGRLSVRY